MSQYPVEGGVVKRRSPKSNDACSWALRRHAIADRLEARGQFKKAWRLRNCRPRKDGGFPCKRPQLCDYCRLVRTLEIRLDYTARALHVVRDSPTTMLFWTTLALGEATDFDAQAQELLDQLRSMPGVSPSWTKVHGCLWFLEPARGASGRWRTHLHCILAVDLDGSPWHHRSLVLAWARAAWERLHPKQPVPRSAVSERAFRRFVRCQDIRPLHCYSIGSLLMPRSRLFSLTELAADVAGLCEYVGMRKDDRPSDRGIRRMGMRADDHLVVDESRRHLRGCSGSFRSIPRGAIDDLVRELRTSDPRLQRRFLVENEAKEPQISSERAHAR